MELKIISQAKSAWSDAKYSVHEQLQDNWKKKKLSAVLWEKFQLWKLSRVRLFSQAMAVQRHASRLLLRQVFSMHPFNYLPGYIYISFSLFFLPSGQSVYNGPVTVIYYTFWRLASLSFERRWSFFLNPKRFYLLQFLTDSNNAYI